MKKGYQKKGCNFFGIYRKQKDNGYLSYVLSLRPVFICSLFFRSFYSLSGGFFSAKQKCKNHSLPYIFLQPTIIYIYIYNNDIYIYKLNRNKAKNPKTLSPGKSYSTFVVKVGFARKQFFRFFFLCGVKKKKRQ